MKWLYRVYKIYTTIGLKLYFRKIVILNPPKFKTGQPTIFAANHASAFMDPLLIGALGNPSVYFLTMASVFKSKLAAKVMSMVQMLPIYRQVDGGDTKKKNEETFNAVYNILKRGENILMFPESQTDEKFIRRIKPIKKGLGRMLFGAEDLVNWEKNYNVVCIGINYSNPGIFGSDVLIDFSEPISASKYKELYSENENKALTQVVKDTTNVLKSKLTHIDKANQYPFFENLLILSYKGMNTANYDKKLTLLERYNYSKELANSFNNLDFESEEVQNMNEASNNYFNWLKKNKIENYIIHEFLKRNSHRLFKHLLFLLVGFPIFLYGFINTIIPYLISKKITESLMKRPVFWNAVKMSLGGLLLLVFLIPTAIYLYNLTSNILIVIAHIIAVLFTSKFAYNYAYSFKDFLMKLKCIKLKNTKAWQDSLTLRQQIINFVNTL